MKWQLLIAWRNLWRNPRRTSVILVSITVGIWTMLFLGAVMWGMIQNMLETSLNNLTGHLQIHHPLYLDDPAIEHRIEDPARLQHVLSEALPAGSRVAWRVRFEVVASNARHSTGLTLVGTREETAMDMTFLGESLIAGRFPEAGGNGILVGARLLDDFETVIGNKLILMARGADGELSSAAFHITGSFDTFLESNETGYAFARAEAVGGFLGIGDAVSEVSVFLPDIAETAAVVETLRSRLDPALYQVMPWEERIPVVTAYMRIWDYFAYVWGLVVFMAMSFGLVNTLLMAVYERIREFGLVRALGTRPGRILVEVLLESALLLLVGLAAGNLLALAAIGWLGATGINLAGFSATTEMFGISRVIYPVIVVRDFLVFNSIVFVLGLLVSLYPALKAARFTPVEAMTHFK